MSFRSYVSIPKRVSEVLKLVMPPEIVAIVIVSIPKRVSEVLKPVEAVEINPYCNVSIPKRVSEVLKPLSLTPSHSHSPSFNP